MMPFFSMRTVRLTAAFFGAALCFARPASAPLIALPGPAALSYSVGAPGYLGSPPAPGYYDIAIKSDKNLQVVQKNVLITGSGTLANVALPAGDANNDNSVGSTDFGLLIGAYGGDVTAPDSGYDSRADFNADGLIDSSDFGLLIGNYGAAGAS